MPTLQDMRCMDSLGIPKFGEQQARAIVQMVKTRRLLADKAPPPAATAQPRGIVIAGGGTYLSWAWTVCKRLRALGCQLPIQVWHLGAKEMPRWAVPLFTALQAQPVDAYEVMKRHPMRQMSGWIVKNYAICHSPWNQVLFLDADCYPYENPEPLMESIGDAPALLFSDIANHRKADWDFVYCAVRAPEKELEAGQYIVNKTTGWRGLQWSMWLNEHTDVFFKHGHGDKHTLQLGYLMGEEPALVSTDCIWRGWGIEQRWDNKPQFAHAMAFKRREHGAPFPEVPAYFKEWREITLGKV